MDNLTIALAAAGGLVLAGVVAHGAWQARKVGEKRVAEPPRAEPLDPVMDGGPAPASANTDAEPELGSELSAPRLLRRPTLRLDALIDAFAPLALEAPVSGDLVLSHLPSSLRAGAKPFLVEGFHVDDAAWESPAAGARYSELQAGVQMANRSGALNEIEFSEFVQKVQAFADAVGAVPDFPDMLDVVARARELDAFAGDHDAQLAVHLQARSAGWSVGFIVQHASRHGFVPGSMPGRLVLPSAEEGAPPVLTLGFDAQAALAEDPNQAVLRDVTLSFDVPQTDVAAQPFVAWQASAQALALGMDAVTVDDNGQLLSPQGFALIERELDRLYEALASRDLAAGSAAARRLFS